MKRVFVFDPTGSDRQSKVRGIGRYLETLKQYFGPDFEFTYSLSQIPRDSIFINPFFDIIKSPLTLRRVAKTQVAVIHDLIRMKYPAHFPAGVRGKINILLNILSLKNYDIIVTDSQHSRDDIIEILHVPPQKVKVVYPALSEKFINTKKVHPASTYDRKPQKYILYVGDATWNKNIVNLARAIKLVDIPCIFVGNVFTSNPSSLIHPEQLELKEFLEEIKGDSRFLFPGFISDEMLIDLYRNAAVNVLVSRDEGFGFSYIEASNLHIPSVLSDIEVFRETAQDTALFAAPEDPADIARQITTLLKDSKLSEKLADEAYTRSLFFSAKRFRENFLDILK